MNESIRKNQIAEYAEELIAPAEIETIEKIDEINDEHGETFIWLISCDTGEEYWVLQGDEPANIFKRSGIYQKAEHVYLAYIDMLDAAPKGSEQPDRFHYE